MKTWYSLYPGHHGLEVLHLGQFNSFDEADEMDRKSYEAGTREPTIWLLNLDELMLLEDNIRKAREIS